MEHGFILTATGGFLKTYYELFNIPKSIIMRNKCTLREDLAKSEFLPVIGLGNKAFIFVQPGKLYNYAWGKNNSFYLVINKKRYEAQSIDFDFHTPTLLALARIIEVDGESFTIDQFLALNHYDRDENDRLCDEDLKSLFSLEVGESMFIHLSLIKRIS